MMFSATVRALLYTQLIQVSLVAIAAWILWRLFAKNRPHFAHAIWALVLIKCLIPPVVSSPTSLFSWYQRIEEPAAVADSTFDSTQMVTTYATDVIAFEPLTPPPDIVMTAVKPVANEVASSRSFLHFYIWFSGAIAGLVFVSIRYLWFLHRVGKVAVDCNAKAEQLLNALIGELEIRRKVRLRILDGPIGPAVLGIFRPTILLPAIIADGKPEDDLRPLIAHELVHVRRGDLWWAWIQSVAKSLWWFHPLVWLSGHMLTREAERSCDEETVSCLGCSPSVYARSLLNVLEQKNQLQAAPALPGVRPIDVTSKRIERIMRLSQGSYTRSPSWVWGFMLISGICVLPGAALVVAQPPAKESPIENDPKASSEAFRPGTDTLNGDVPEEEYSLRVYKVSDLLDQIVSEGIGKQQAKTELLQLLPATSVRPAAIASPNASKSPSSSAASHPPAAVPQVLAAAPQREDPKDRTTRTLENGRLTVHATATTHKVIRESIDWFREFGFHQVMMKMHVLQVPNDKVAALTSAAKLLGNVDKNDDGQSASLAETRSDLSVLLPAMKPNQIDAWIRECQANGATILSRPQIITPNGRKATVHAGTSIPILMREQGSDAQDASKVAGFAESGFKAVARPQLTDEGSIQLELQLELATVTDERIKSSTSVSGKTFVFDAPVIVKAMMKTHVDVPLDTPMLIAGPLQASLNNKQANRSQPNRFAVLLSCQAVSPFQSVPDERKSSEHDTTQSLPAQRPSSQATPAKAARDLQVRANAIDRVAVQANKGKTLIAFHFGESAIEISGDVSVRSNHLGATVSGTDLFVRIREPNTAQQADWVGFGADQGEIRLTHSSSSDVPNAMDARLVGHAVYQLNGKERIRADRLEFCDEGKLIGTNVLVDFEHLELRAEQLQMNSSKGVATASGNVRVKGELKADSINLETTGRLTSADFDLNVLDEK